MVLTMKKINESPKINDLDNCNICNNNKFEKIADNLRESDKYKIYRCIPCSHIQLLPRPNGEMEKQFYDEDKQERAIRPDVNLDKLRKNFRFDVLRRAEFISNNLPKNKKNLDIGCGDGFFLEEMINRGYKIRGIEISKTRRELAKTFIKVPILDIDLTESYTGDERYDIVTLFHVLEHLIDPIKFCRNVSQLLAKNGCFIVEVPNVDELLLETCPAYNEFYWTRAHLNYFSKKTLELVLKKAGFKKIRIMYVQRYGIDNLFNWSIIGKPQIKKPVFETCDSYKWLEKCYREHLEKIGKSDTIFAVVYK